MLTILRKKAASWITKLIIGLIAVVFILYFGSSALRKAEKGEKVLIRIDGQAIHDSDLDGLFQLQKDSNPKMYENLPASLEPQIRQGILRELVETKLTNKAAQKNGLRVSPDELAKIIYENPNFRKNDKFDEQNYRESFLPAFLNRYGVEYEDHISQALLSDKWRELFTDASTSAKQELINAFVLENTLYTFKKMDDATKKEEETPPTPLSKLNQLFGELKNGDILALARLTPASPSLAEPLHVGDKTFSITLVKLTPPDWTKFEEARSDLADQSARQAAFMAYNHWFEEAKKSVR